ncbi:hypothetical protein FS837_004749, partial [Tulasnella sp. UAMH 9824]
ELAELIKSGKVPRKDYIVIDVRDEDFARYAKRRKADADLMTGTDAATVVSQGDKQEIFVLEGGFTKFQQEFKDDPQLVEKWDKEFWAEETWEEEERDRDDKVWALDD